MGKYNTILPTTWITEEMSSVIQHFVDKYGMSKAQAVRHIFDNGVQYMAIFGDGVAEKIGDNS